jgi:hypothetical protein
MWFTPRDTNFIVVATRPASATDILCLEVKPEEFGVSLSLLQRIHDFRGPAEFPPNILVACACATLNWKEREAIRARVAAYGATLFEGKDAETLRSEVQKSFASLCKPSAAPFLHSNANVSQFIANAASARLDCASTARSLSDEEMSAAAGGIKFHKGNSGVKSLAQTIGSRLGNIARSLKLIASSIE